MSIDSGTTLMGYFNGDKETREAATKEMSEGDVNKLNALEESGLKVLTL